MTATDWMKPQQNNIETLLCTEASRGADPHMNPLPKEFESSSPEFEYNDFSGGPDMRYGQDTNTASALNLGSAVQTVQPSPVLPLYPQGQPTSLFSSATPYPQESPTTSIYTGAPHSLIPSAHLRRLPSSSTPSIGMHGHRNALPLPDQINTRGVYPTSLRRSQEQRSPSSFTGALARRNPISSPTSSSHLGFSGPGHRMDPFPKTSQQSLPPLMALVPLGSLYYMDNTSPSGSKISFDIHGVIDKGFFLAENEWTCYRRNYFSCICSYNLSPPPHSSWSSSPPIIHFVRDSDGATFQVTGGFAMSISAVVAENDQQTIELVQHTPKRDKGPTTAPEKVRLSPKSSSHPHLGVFTQADGTLTRPYDFNQSQPSTLGTEHTFERIQFKQATANNGKRRAAQQYYHLVVELWADVAGPQNSGQAQWVKVGFKKSAKMIVRGRSPGHYQSERRGSTSSGPGGAAGNLGYGSLGTDFTSAGSGMLPSTFGHSGYDPRGGSQYGSSTRHSQEVSVDAIMTDDPKPMHETKDYNYYPTAIYENGHSVEMFQHSTRDQHVGANGHTLASPVDHPAKVKPEYDGGRPSLFQPGPQWNRAGQCGRYESKHTSNGFYPTVAPSGLNMT